MVGTSNLGSIYPEMAIEYSSTFLHVPYEMRSIAERRIYELSFSTVTSMILDLPSGYLTVGYWKWPIYRWCSQL